MRLYLHLQGHKCQQARPKPKKHTTSSPQFLWHTIALHQLAQDLVLALWVLMQVRELYDLQAHIPFASLFNAANGIAFVVELVL
jgi:hypothetical protein